LSDNILIPKNERLWTTYRNVHNEILLYITSNNSRDTYFLYEVQRNACKKLGKAKTPQELEEKFNIWEVLYKRC
jgi:hypothetical protein